VVRNDFDILMGSERKVSRLTFNQNRRAIKVLVIPHSAEEACRYKDLKWFREVIIPENPCAYSHLFFFFQKGMGVAIKNNGISDERNRNT